MSFENNSTSSDIQKQTPPNNTSKDIKPYNPEGFKNISNINDFLTNLEKNPKIGDIPKNTEDRIRELAKNPQIFDAFKIKIQSLSSAMNLKMLEIFLAKSEANNNIDRTVDETNQTVDETNQTVDEKTKLMMKKQKL